MRISSFSRTICWKDCSFPILWYKHICQKSMGCNFVWVYFFALSSVGLCICFYANIVLFLATISLLYVLIPECIMLPALNFLFRIGLVIWDILWFHINFWIILSFSVKNVTENLIGITLILFISLDSIDISKYYYFTYVNMCFHLFVFLIYFINIL